MPEQTSSEKSLPCRFPADDYTPYGYLHTPTHTGLHPSGIVRSVRAAGFGLWTGGLSWYGMNQLRNVNNYVCMALPRVKAGGLWLCERADFDRAGVAPRVAVPFRQPS
jgi:hypothetical protein